MQANTAQSDNIRYEATITCPHCEHKQVETMPADACTYFYECPHCHELLKPKDGDCCVFCSYAYVSCPPVQKNGNESCC